MASSLAVEFSLALAAAPALDLSEDIVEACLDSGDERARAADSQLRGVFERGLAAVPRTERAGSLNGATGHLAESVVESILGDAGWIAVEHFVGPFSGGHGVDLGMMSPAFDRIFAIEVKGTFQPTRWPQLSRGTIDQMTQEWLSKPDNPAVSSVGVNPNEYSAMVVLVQFSLRKWKAAISDKLVSAMPLSSIEQLGDLGWLS
jgi:hypothetical protein